MRQLLVWVGVMCSAACGTQRPGDGGPRLPDPVGGARPMRVAGVGRGWAALRQADEGWQLDRAPLQLIWKKRGRTRTVAIDALVAVSTDDRPVVAIEGRLVELAFKERHDVALGPAEIDGRPRRVIGAGDGVVIADGARLTFERYGEVSVVELPSAPLSIEPYGAAVLAELDTGETIVVRSDGIDADTDERFATLYEPLEVDGDGGVQIYGTRIPYACRAILAVSGSPLRIAARCEHGTLIIRGEGDPVDLEELYDPGPIEGDPFDQTVRVDGRLWCDEGEDCIDLFTGKIYAARPFWVGDQYALVRDGATLVALDLDHGWRWGVAGAAPLIEEQGGERVAASEGAIVAIGGQVIDVANHLVISEGPWVIHAVDDDGSAAVTEVIELVDWTRGPVRWVAPGTRAVPRVSEDEVDVEDDEDEDEDD